jgi:hypothetical protein
MPNQEPILTQSPSFQTFRSSSFAVLQFVEYKRNVTYQDVKIRDGSLSKPGMHNIRPAGQMWPPEGFYLARAALSFACFFHENIIDEKKILGP